MYGVMKFWLLTFPSYPEAQTSSLATTVTPVSEFSGLMPSWSEGVDTRDHRRPFQCAARVVATALVPTAHTSFGATAAIPVPNCSVPPEGGWTALHDVPSKCSNSKMFSSTLCSHPTAHRSPGPAAAMALSTSPEFPVTAGFGLGTMLQLVPSQCSINVRSSVLSARGSVLSPTAHALVRLRSR